MGICKHCDCSGNEQTCRLENEKLTCVCKDGFEGEKCDKVVGSPGEYSSNHDKHMISLITLYIFAFQMFHL